MKKKQHYVPQMVLKNFTTEDDAERCWEYNLYTRRISLKRVEEICAEKYLYEIKTNEGDFFYPPGTNKMEDGFGEIETSYAPFFDELFQRFDTGKSICFSKEEHDSIVSWVFLLITRNPTVKQALPYAAEEIGIKLEDELAINYNYINMMPSGLEYFYKDLCKGHISILKANTSFGFVISDIPVLFKGTPIHEFCYTPLSTEYALLFERPSSALIDVRKCNVISLSERQVADYNVLMYNALLNAYDNNYRLGFSLISNDKNTLSRLVMPGMKSVKGII